MNHLLGKKFGKVEIKKFLGEGGYGYTYIGFDESVEKDRIIKVAKKSLNSEEDKTASSGFHLEGTILARLKHPQIVQLLDRGEEHQLQYMVLEKINGFDFQTVLQTLKKRRDEINCEWSSLVDPLSALAIVVSALRPLAYAHGVKIELPGMEVVEGLAHRDISAGNLMLGHGHEHEGSIHLIDFGVAKANVNESKTVNTAIIGSPKYMSPMRLMKKGRGEGKGPYWSNFKQTQHDVHALGCFLYELIFGRHFLDGLDMIESLGAIQNPGTYSEIYKDILGLDKNVQRLIKQSIVYPDIKTGKGGFQYPTAIEMLADAEQVFNDLSGGADIKKILIDFSKEINDPGLLKEGGGSGSRVAKHTSKNIKSTYIKNSNTKLVIIAILVVVMTIVLISLFINKKQVPSNPVITEVKIPLKKVDTKFEKGIVETNPEVSLFDTIVEVETLFVESNKKQNEHVVTKNEVRKTKNNNEVNVVTEKNIPKEIVSDGREEYYAVLKEIRAGNTEEAYQKLTSYITIYNDGAFYVLKAILILKRNPESKNGIQLKNEGYRIGSKIISSSELQMLDLNL